MRRANLVLLEMLLLLSSIAALVYFLRILLSFVLPINWYWGGAAAVATTPLLATAALWCLNRLPPSGIKTDA